MCIQLLILLRREINGQTFRWPPYTEGSAYGGFCHHLSGPDDIYARNQGATHRADLKE